MGNISLSESLNAKLDLNKLISRHLAILGSTGSGKSNAVGVLLNAIAKKHYRSARILVIDPHGEYNSVLKKESNVYKVKVTKKDSEEKKLYVPFWALPFEELLSIFSGNLNDQQKEYFRAQIAAAKLKTVENEKLSIAKELVTADTPIPFDLKKIWFELDDFERQTFMERAQKLVSNEYEPASAGGGRPFLNNQAKGILG